MLDAAAFQHGFGAALAGQIAGRSPTMVRALAIHRNTAAKAARDALADNFPVVRQLVGDDAFDAAADAFVAVAPPTDPRLCLYGDGFAAFLSRHAPFVELAYLPDIAALERLVIEALFAADAAALSGDALASVDLDAPLALHPAVRFAAFTSSAGSIWLAHQPDAAADALDTLEWRAETVLVTRPADAVRVTVLPNGSEPFLAACADHRPLGDAAARVAPDALAPLFATLIAAGTFA